MASYTWSIVDMKNYPSYKGQSNVVFSVNWQCLASQENVEVCSNGTVNVTYQSGEAFTPYTDLTEEVVWSWVNPNIDRAAIEANLQSMLNDKLSPQEQVSPLPWA